MSLRDEINHMVSRHDCCMKDNFADAILSMPSGLVAVKECNSCGGRGVIRFISTSSCSECHGTGRIVRDMSIQEVVDRTIDGSLRIEVIQGVMYRWIHTTGERVEMDK